MDPQLLEHAERILEALKWHGVAMVEFKRDTRDGVPKLLEINGRFWGSLQLAVDSGVDSITYSTDWPSTATSTRCSPIASEFASAGGCDLDYSSDFVKEVRRSDSTPDSS
jgi:hypothetical protein